MDKEMQIRQDRQKHDSIGPSDRTLSTRPGSLLAIHTSAH